MKYLIYMSSAVKLMGDDELLEILTVSRENNTAKNLTGMLLYGEGAFVQVLEGEPDVLDATYDIIKADPRHKNMIEIMQGEITKRNFPNWSMGFRTVNADVVSQFKGFANVKKDGFDIKDDKHPALTILATFAETSNMMR